MDRYTLDEFMDMNKEEMENIKAVSSHSQSKIDILRRCKNLWFSDLNIYKSYL